MMACHRPERNENPRRTNKDAERWSEGPYEGPRAAGFHGSIAKNA